MELTDKISQHFTAVECENLAISRVKVEGVYDLVEVGTIGAAVQLLEMMAADHIDWCTESYAEEQKEMAYSSGFSDGHDAGCLETRKDMQKEVDENIAVGIREAEEGMEERLRIEIGDSLDLYWDERFGKMADDYDALAHSNQQREDDLITQIEDMQNELMRQRLRADFAESRLNVVLGGKIRKRIRRKPK